MIPWVVFWTVLGVGCSNSVPKETDKLYSEGMEFFRAGQWKEAAEHFQRCLRLAPDSTAAQVRLGEIYLAMGQREATMQMLETITGAGLERPETLILQARLLSLDRRIAEARTLAEEVLKSHPRSIDAKLLLAQLGLRADFAMDLEHTRKLCREILHAVPQERRAALMLLKAELRLGRFEQALELGRQLTQQYPESYTLALLAGTAALWKGDGTAAMPFLQRAVDLSLDQYEERLKALWLIKLVYWEGYPADLSDRYRLVAPEAMPVSTSVRFVDIAPSAGVDKIDRGRGSAWLDYDLDGDPDLFSVGIRTLHELYRNDGDGRFHTVTETAGLADARGGWGAARADFDNDGDADIFVTRDAWEGKALNSLYRNDSGAFSDVALQVGMIDSACSFTATWGDYDLDGYLDIYVANGVLGDGGKNNLYRNGQNGSFADVAVNAGVADPSKTIGCSFGDYDGDGHPDLYVVNIGQPNRLYHNGGDGTFTDQAAKADVLFPLEGGYVTFFFDYDNDGALDLFVATMSSLEGMLSSGVEGQNSQLNRPFLYRNNGDGTFTDATAAAGLDRSFSTMGIGVGDIDNDGFADIYLANGGPEMYRLEPNTLLLNQRDGTFADITSEAGVGNLGKGHGATFADFDGDGDMDLYAGLGGHYDGDVWPNSLYRNDGENGHFLAVITRGTESNRDGIGARVSLYSGEHQVHAEVASGYGFGSSNAPVLHLGLDDEIVDRLEIRWPSGRRQSWEHIPANRVIRLTEGSADYEIARRPP